MEEWNASLVNKGGRRSYLLVQKATWYKKIYVPDVTRELLERGSRRI